MVEGLKHPVIFSLETHLARIAPQTQKEFDNLEALRWRFQLVVERESGCRQQARKCVPGPGVGCDNRRSKFRTSPLFALADVDFHTDGTAAFEENPGDLAIGQQFAACRADYRAGRLGNFACSSIRIPRSVQIMGGDHRMRGKGALTRGHSIVGPLRRDQGANPRVAKTPREIMLCDFRGSRT